MRRNPEAHCFDQLLLFLVLLYIIQSIIFYRAHSILIIFLFYAAIKIIESK